MAWNGARKYYANIMRIPRRTTGEKIRGERLKPTLILLMALLACKSAEMSKIHSRFAYKLMFSRSHFKYIGKHFKQFGKAWQHIKLSDILELRK